MEPANSEALFGGSAPPVGAPPRPRAAEIRAAILGFYERQQAAAAARGAGVERPLRLSVDVIRTDRLAVSVARALATLALPLGRAAAAFGDQRAWRRFGYARLDDHARERFQRTGRWVRDQADLGRSLDRLPSLAAALSGADGRRRIGKVGARAVGKVATAETVDAWIAFARRVTVRELQSAVRARRGRPDPWPPSREPGAEADAEPHAAGQATDDSAEGRRSVRLPAPAPAVVAFDETLRLHRAVSGSETSVTEFLDALVAEAHAGLSPPDAVQAPVAPSIDSAELERALARRSRDWAHLEDPPDAAPALLLAEETLRKFHALEKVAGTGDAARLDRQLRELIALEDVLEQRLGELLLQLSLLRAWASMMFAGVRHYGEQRLGLSRTGVERRMRLARSLRRFPRLAEAYAAGRLGIEATLIVVRILGIDDAADDDEVQLSWIERAATATIKRLLDEERALKGAAVLSGLVEPVEPATQPGRGGDAACGPLSDAQWHGSIGLREGEIRARVHQLGYLAAGQASSDVFLRLRLDAETADRFLAAVESARRHLEQEARDSATVGADPDGRSPADVDLDPPSLSAARRHVAMGRTVPGWVGLLALLEDFVDTWDDVDAAPDRRAKAIYSRDGWRCSAPGCTSRRNLEDHHVVYRSRGGDRKAPENRICLCRFHHQQGEHGGCASVRGTAPLGLDWRLGVEGLGGWFRNEIRVPPRGRYVDGPHAAHPGLTTRPAEPRA